MDINIILKLLLSVWLGALIWMERGIHNNHENGRKNNVTFWEIRTFALISFLWAFSTEISILFWSYWILILALIFIWLYIWIYYTYSVFKEKKFWLTTEIWAIITFFLWVSVMIWYEKESIILSIILTFLLSLKPFLENIVKKISLKELNNTIKFAVIAIVILPILPDYKYSIMEILKIMWFTKDLDYVILNVSFLNLYWIWFFVVLMSGISYIWYIMSKIIWEKSSIIASGAIWGLISSTAVTASMTNASTSDIKNRESYVVSTLLASTIMFIRVVIIVLFFNINLLSSIIYPSIFMLVWMVLYIIYFYFKSNKKKATISKQVVDDEKKYTSPFMVWPALKFAWFVLMIKFISALWSVYQDVWWDYFFYALGVISWLADVDAVSQTMAVDSLDAKIWAKLAATTIIIAIISNNFVKWWIAFKLWEKRFWIEVLMGFVVSMVMGVLGLVVMGMMG